MNKPSKFFVLGCLSPPSCQFCSACCLGEVLCPLQRARWPYMSWPICLRCFCPDTCRASGHPDVTQLLEQSFPPAKISTNPVLRNGVLMSYMSLVRSRWFFFTILVDARMQGHARSEAVRSVIGFGTSTSWYAILPPLPGSKLMASKIPSYAAFKMWSNFIGPMISRSRGDNSKTPADEKSTLSKRQEKLRKRSEKGDPRVRTVRK